MPKDLPSRRGGEDLALEVGGRLDLVGEVLANHERKVAVAGVVLPLSATIFSGMPCRTALYKPAPGEPPAASRLPFASSVVSVAPLLIWTISTSMPRASDVEA